LDILEFDFHKFGESYLANKGAIKNRLLCYSTNRGVELEIVNKAFMLSK